MGHGHSFRVEVALSGAPDPVFSEYMPVRDKGPLFIIYLFDSFPELQA